MRLIHAADIHLGRRRLDGRLPDSDFAAAFHCIAEAAIARKADALLLAGDLFDRPQVEPPQLRQAQQVLARLKAAGIPVLAAEGNHDKACLSSDQPTWLDYLADDDLLMLLATRFGPEGPMLTPWQRETRRGAWVELHGVRFTGAGYLGAATPHKVRQIVQRLEPGHAHVLLLHAGPDYFVGEAGGFSGEDLRCLRERLNYLALGHIHKPMIHQGWACNPGSPENCDLNEAHYDRDKNGLPCPRGYAWVELDETPGQPPKHLEICSNPRRPVFHLNLECTPFGNKLKDGAVALEKAACKLMAAQAVPAEAAVVLRLTGRINLGRICLDLQVAAQRIEQTSGVRAVALDPSAINLGVEGAEGGFVDTQLSREALERAAVRGLVENEHLWGLDGEQEVIANLLFDLKEGVRLNKSPEELAELVQVCPVIDKIQAALEAAATPATPAGAPSAEGGTP
ncbi:MAG TPA: metallophosphoesterase [Candidatus Sulfotelmatobacter sp.]|nr:metallophosphoesterase [Candidatus Sulfotelmatobacter sp.]HWI59992.1 metallophosphoesterase [Bacillota bacterium]